MKTPTQILIVLFALVFVSMGAHFATSSETFKQSLEQADHPDMIESFIQQEKLMKRHFKLENLPKRLRAKLGAKNLKSYLTNEQHIQKEKWSKNKLKQFQSKNNLGQVIFKGDQYDVLIINQSTVLTISAYQNRLLTLNLVNIQSKTNFTKIYNQFQVNHDRLALKLFDEKTAAIFSESFFFVVNLNDLTLRQQIPIEKQYNAYSEYFIDNYVKNEILVGYGDRKYYTLQFNSQSNKYENLTEFYKPAHELYRMNAKEGISFWNYYKIPVNLTSQFKIFSRDYEQPPAFQIVSVVSNSEDIVVFCYDFLIKNQVFAFYTLNKTNYGLEERFYFNLTDDFMIDPRKARFTHDDKHFFFNMKHTQLNYRAVGVVKVGTGKVTYFDMEGENMTDFTCFDYGILSDTQFVVVCQSLKKNEQVQAQNQYKLWLYNMSNFKLLDTYSVLAEATDLEIKTNPSFNSAFILQIFDTQNKPNLRMFQVVNNKITSGSIPSNFTNFRIAADCLNYLVGVFGDEPFHSFVNVKNFTVIKKTPIYDIEHKYDPSDFIHGIKDYMVQNNILAICNQKDYYSFCQMYEFYDLSKLGMPGDADFLCFFFVGNSNQFGFFLPKEKYVFQHQGIEFQKLDGYDLQKCPTKKLIPLQINQDPNDRLRKSLYKRNNVSEKSAKRFTNPTQQQQQTCNLIYLLAAKNKIFVVQDCEPYKLVSQTIIPSNMIDGFYSSAHSIYFSSNYKYLIIQIWNLNNTAPGKVLDQLEIRPLNDLSRSLHKTVLEQFKWILGTADVTEKDEIIYASSQGIFLEKMNVTRKGQAEKPLNRRKIQVFEKMKENYIEQ